MIAVLTASKAFTMDEIRAIWGLDPATEKQVEEIIEWLQSTASPSGFGATSGAQASDDLVKRKQNTSATAGQESQGKRSKDLIQRGQDKGRRQAV